jgi:6-phosphofructokinase
MTGRETRCVVLGIFSGRTPNAFDRMLATNFGSCAVRGVAEGQSGVYGSVTSGRRCYGSAY